MQEMKGGWRTPRALTLLFGLLTIGVVVVCTILWVKLQTPNYPATVQSSAKQVKTEYPDPYHLNTTPSTEATQTHLLDRDFTVVGRLREIPNECESRFDSSFVRADGSSSGPEGIKVADPDQEFQFSDAIMPGLPFRRLAFAGVSHTGCFIYYQRGGPMPATYCLAFMEYGKSKAAWVGERPEGATSLKALRSMLSRKSFDTSGQPVC